ncbi:MAG: response regulator transcription factor [Dehalococcoidia bacterium]|nr:response regulator transcription factor [Dehalococcoidia bacterium]
MTIQPLLLAVDDEPGILRLLKLELGAQDFKVLTATNGDEAIRIIEERRPDCVLLDIMMPGESGLEVMNKIRERGRTPVILLTAKDRETDKVRGLELGADDYIVKPFNLLELGARIRAVLRRVRGITPTAPVTAGNLEIDLSRRIVTKNGTMVNLTRTEWLLLEHLSANAGKLVTNRELLTKVWGPEYVDDLQYLRVWVSRIRQKIEDNPGDPQYIRTFQGLGYMFTDDAAAEEHARGKAAAMASPSS